MCTYLYKFWSVGSLLGHFSYNGINENKKSLNWSPKIGQLILKKGQLIYKKGQLVSKNESSDLENMIYTNLQYKYHKLNAKIGHQAYISPCRLDGLIMVNWS